MSHQVFFFTKHLQVGGFSPDTCMRSTMSGLKPPTYKIHQNPTGCARNQFYLQSGQNPFGP
ncbi:hypothetical protein B9Z51_11365 [Limnohabitans sp. T6-5]|nr:hypothetical protein B9Z51_11365 [Limnohabitans sp. T6-5]